MSDAKIQARECAIRDCFHIKPTVFRDERGTFVKILCDELFERLNKKVHFNESFFSQSKVGVFRGLHFQLPPHDHYKLVYCSQGSILDVFVDCRAESPTFGKHFIAHLDARTCEAIWLPPGIAHGFLAKEDDATVIYHVSSSWNCQSDSGILWSSLPALHELQSQLLSVSKRDSSFATWDAWREKFENMAGSWKI